jgi:osmoprotectant transport system ATP-binding protein
VLEIDGVEKRFGAKVALGPATLSVGRGETLALLGSSGSGKSTLLRVVAGLETADRGEVRIDGVRVAVDTLPRLRLQMGYVIQEGGLFPHLTAEENVTLVARQLGRPTDEMAARVRSLASLVQLPGDVLGRYPGQLSGGQRQRVSLMRALMLEPKLVLLDEPLGALDPIVRAELAEDLARIFRESEATAVLVTHDVAEAALLGHRVALMREGRVVQCGPFAELEEAPAEPFVTRFLTAHALSAARGRPGERAS